MGLLISPNHGKSYTQSPMADKYLCQQALSFCAHTKALWSFASNTLVFCVLTFVTSISAAVVDDFILMTL